MPILQCVDNQLIGMIYEENALFASVRAVYDFGTMVKKG